MGRREFLGKAGTVGLVLGIPGRAGPSPYPFGLGVASGDPWPDGVVLWTRLAPEPLCPDPARPGGMAGRDVEVDWQVAADERFTKVVRHGRTRARAGLAHSVHVEVGGLRPGRDYHYRFRTAGEISPAGRTRTAPEGRPAQVRFAFTSCQNYQHGFYTAHRHLAAEDVDVVLHLGDYIYECDTAPAGGTVVRPHGTPEPVDLAGYRLRHALYRTDPDLRAAHAAAPWIVTWDDHDVVNNYSGGEAPGMDRQAFARRRAGAYQAYYEHMPLRRASVPRGPDMRINRRLRYGHLVDFWVLDTRQFRVARPPWVDLLPPDLASRLGVDRRSPDRAMLGGTQERWLLDGLARSRARWKILAQQVVMAQRNMAPPGGGEVYRLDTWDGFPVARERLLRGIADRRIDNVTVLTGDAHTNLAAELKTDFDDPAAPCVGVELVGTSVTSRGDGGDVRPDTPALLAANPHVKFANDLRGYVVCTATAGTLRADYRVLPYVGRPGASVHTRATFEITAGRPRLERVAERRPPGARRVSPPSPPDAVEG
ncbi:alkaline phosphatase D family protein [Actinomadura barringtoniae]|uniref:Alkaline phosphatase D family protein n=1 Tax=Actinomadura barringtoniae TaxID=1427535 RepID=A0A939T2N5_9ACTN|nr:alkaline phosphatase D family protein [Actinomadura barringtoniae]